MDKLPTHQSVHGTPAGDFPHMLSGLWNPEGDLWASLAHGCVLWQQLPPVQGLNCSFRHGGPRPSLFTFWILSFSSRGSF